MNVEKPLPTEHQLYAVYPNLFTDDAVALQFLIEAQILIVPVHCSTCGGNMLRVNRSKYQYYCTRHACTRSCSILSGSFFAGCKSVARTLRMVYCILAEMGNGVIRNVTGIDHKTITKWRAVVQEMMSIDELSLPDEDRMMGGPEWFDGTDALVEMDESKFAKIKYGYGHPVAAGWVFGLIERKRGHVKGKFVAFAVDNRNAI